jgi:hypothetical protein
MVVFLWALLGIARGEVIDRVVASVDEQLVTASEVRLEDALAPRSVSTSPFWRPDHASSLSRLIDAAVVRELAGDLALYQPTLAEVDERTAALREAFADRAAWQAFLAVNGLDEAALAALIRRRLVVERYLARNVPVRTTDETVWLAACDQLLTEQRAKFRIRAIAPAEGP